MKPDEKESCEGPGRNGAHCQEMHQSEVPHGEGAWEIRTLTFSLPLILPSPAGSPFLDPGRSHRALKLIDAVSSNKCPGYKTGCKNVENRSRGAKGRHYPSTFHVSLGTMQCQALLLV